ncbi:MAG: ABC transporter ATP-binding protein [Candidatus Saelkia tenebricola]|nr:ABC transporter ATP-binding protein [Candidatus Saelkia tenebricola]
MIELVDIHKNFGNQKVLNGVSLKIEKGQTFALIGGSGKGKSVLLKHIIGLLKPDKGKILIEQQDISRLRGKKLKQLKERFGIVFQGGALFDSLDVFENTAFPLEEKTKLNSSQIRDKVLKELANVGLEGDENKYPAQISGGMRKRVALARCLVMNPEIILFDEPTTGLDPMTMKSIHKLIRTLQKERHLTALIVSHEIPEIFNIVDQVAMLYNGEIITVGTPEEIKTSNNKIIREFICRDFG